MMWRTGLGKRRFGFGVFFTLKNARQCSPIQTVRFMFEQNYPKVTLSQLRSKPVRTRRPPNASIATGIEDHLNVLSTKCVEPCSNEKNCLELENRGFPKERGGFRDFSEIGFTMRFKET